MLIWTLVVFAIAAVGGLVMAIGHFRGRTPPPVPLAVVHGLFAFAGLVLLLWIVFGPEDAGLAAKIALAIFLLAAIGGFTLAFGFHARKRRLYGGLIAAHGALAVVAFLLLLAGVLRLL